MLNQSMWLSWKKLAQPSKLKQYLDVVIRNEKLKIKRTLFSLTAIFFVTACAQSEAVVVEPIAAEPTYDKWGNDGGGCTGGTAGASANCLPSSGGGYERTPGTPGLDGGGDSGGGGSAAGTA